MKKTAVLVACLSLIAGTRCALSAADLSLLNVFPNPARTYAGESQITFQGVPEARVRIYNALGNLVRDRELGAGETTFLWDLKNDAGRDVASGVYVYFITSGGDERTGKLAVIR